ncbi:hypothetical protein [Demequina litorisediminis]|nr:hypothetical protein [Demequina litorisediminis]
MASMVPAQGRGAAPRRGWIDVAAGSVGDPRGLQPCTEILTTQIWVP